MFVFGAVQLIISILQSRVNEKAKYIWKNNNLANSMAGEQQYQVDALHCRNLDISVCALHMWYPPATFLS